jgi:hypothetical protein
VGDKGATDGQRAYRFLMQNTLNQPPNPPLQLTASREIGAILARSRAARSRQLNGKSLGGSPITPIPVSSKSAS